MLKKEWLETVLFWIDEKVEDAEAALEDEEAGEQEEAEYADAIAMQMAFEAMKEMNWSSDIEVLRAENAMLRKIVEAMKMNAQAIIDVAEKI